VDTLQPKPERMSEMTIAELEKIHADIAKLMAETAKINLETM
jgi:hypothetical protein